MQSPATSNPENRRTLTAQFETTPLPTGWRRTHFQRGDQPVTLLSADHPGDELRLHLAGRGPTSIHLGLAVIDGSHNSAMQIRVDPGGNWRRVRPMRFMLACNTAVQDAHLGTFDLSADSVLRIRTERNGAAALAYVHAGPAVDPEPRHKHNAGVVFDSNMTMSTCRIDEPDDLLNVLRPYINSDFSHIFWGTTVGTYSPLYFADRLAWHGKEKLDFCADHRIATARVMRMFADKGIDPFQFAIDFAHANGLELWADYRINKNHDSDFVEDYAGGRFLCAHRDKLVRNRDGSPHDQLNLSFAWPEIRQMAVDMLVAQASYNVDGLFIDFCRQYPLVGWEKPVLEAFKSTTGHDPQTQPVSTWRVAWYQHLCGYVTLFLQELRAALKPLEKQRGRRIPLAVQVPGGWRFGDAIFACMADALDPATWAKQGLVDIIAPAERTALMLEGLCLDRFSQLQAETNCKLWGAIGPYFREGRATPQQRGKSDWLFADADPWRMMALAHDYYQQGADGVFIWEAHELTDVPQRWNVIRRIGDRDHLRNTFGDKLGRFDGSHWIDSSPLTPI